MTEYTTDPEAIAHYLAARARTAHWVDSLSGKALVAPSIPPSLVSDTDDGLSSQDSDAESSRSLPPRMVLRYPDGRPDVPVSTNPRWPPQNQKPTTPTPFHTRLRAGSGSHGYPPSNPNIHSRAPSNAVPLYISPPPPVVAMQPETIHVRPSPTSPVPHQGPVSYLTAGPHHSSSLSTPSRQRSMRSTPSSRPPLQMIYTPPAPSSLSRSAPVSPTHESFQSAQQPLPPPPPSAPYPPIAAPSPVYGFPSPTSAHEPPPAAPLTHSRTHSRSHSYSSNQSHPHPQAAAGAASAPPSAYPGNSAQRQRRHSSRTGTSHGHADVMQHPQPQPQAPAVGVGGGPSFASGASGSGSRRRGPPSIVYAPSVNSSLYAYNPPVITSRPPQPQPPHVMAPQDPHARAYTHAHAHRMAQSISDPTPITGSLGRNASRGRMFEHLSRTPSPNTARTRVNEASGAVASGLLRKGRVRGSRDKSRRRDGGDHNGNDDDYNDEAASFSSGSTYYVLPSPGQKIKVVVRYSTSFSSPLRYGILNRVPIHTASKYHERALRRAHLRVQVDASTPKPPITARAVLCWFCAATTATAVTTAKAAALATHFPSPIRFWQCRRRRRKRSVIGLAACFSALIRHLSAYVCMYVYVCSAIVEVRGGHAAEELVFLLPYHHASTSTSNHQPFNGPAWRGAGCIAIVVDVDADMDASLKSVAVTDLHSSFPFRSLFSAHFFSASSASSLPTP
jgi:hypothetical protein